MTLVRDAMSRGVVSVPIDTELRDVARTMQRFDVTGVPVTDPEEGTVGVVTHTDLVEHYGVNGLTAEDAMTELPDTIRPTADLSEAAKRMSDAGIHRLFVQPEGRIFECDTCMGVLTSSDLVDAMAEE